MILSTCGASAAGFQTTSFAARAAWARRTSHQGAVVDTRVTVAAVLRISRRVVMMASLSFHSTERQSLDDPALEDEEHEHRGQGAHHGRGHKRPPEEHVLRHEVHQAGGHRPGARALVVRVNRWAYRNSFQACVNEKNVTTTRAGSDIGSTIRTSAPTRLQPSTRAASSSSTGTDLKYPMSSQVQKGTSNPRYAMMSPCRLSVRRRTLIMANMGMKSSDVGTRYVNTRPRARSARPGKLSRAIA